MDVPAAVGKANGKHKVEICETEEGPPRKEAKVKTKSTGKTARMLKEAGSPQVCLFGVNLLKKMYTPLTPAPRPTQRPRL